MPKHKRVYQNQKPMDHLPTGWISGMKHGIPVAVNEDWGWVANIHTGDLLKPSLNRNNGGVVINVPYNLGTTPWLGKGTLLPLGRLVNLVVNGPPDEDLVKTAGNKPSGIWAYHVNGEKTDNRPENLKWVTPSKAMQHSLARGTLHTYLNEEQVRIIRRAADKLAGTEDGVSPEAIARAFGISATYVRRLLQTGLDGSWRHWKHVSQSDSTTNKGEKARMSRIRAAENAIQNWIDKSEAETSGYNIKTLLN